MRPRLRSTVHHVSVGSMVWATTTSKDGWVTTRWRTVTCAQKANFRVIQDPAHVRGVHAVAMVLNVGPRHVNAPERALRVVLAGMVLPLHCALPCAPRAGTATRAPRVANFARLGNSAALKAHNSARHASLASFQAL